LPRELLRSLDDDLLIRIGVAQQELIAELKRVEAEHFPVKVEIARRGLWHRMPQSN